MGVKTGELTPAVVGNTELAEGGRGSGVGEVDHVATRNLTGVERTLHVVGVNEVHPGASSKGERKRKGGEK